MDPGRWFTLWKQLIDRDVSKEKQETEQKTALDAPGEVTYVETTDAMVKACPELCDGASFCSPDIRTYIFAQIEGRNWMQRHFRGLEAAPWSLSVYGTSSRLFHPRANKIYQYTRAVYTWLKTVVLRDLLQNSDPIQSPKSIHIVLLLTPLRKRASFNTTQQTRLTPTNVNSGETSWANGHNGHVRIVLWRYEEWSKVLIHELLHAFAFDARFSSEQDKRYKVYEAWIESWAAYLHTFTPSHHRTLDMCNLAWNRELRHFFMQAFILQNTSWTPYKTAVRAYYLLKYAFCRRPVHRWMRDWQRVAQDWSTLMRLAVPFVHKLDSSDPRSLLVTLAEPLTLTNHSMRMTITSEYDTLPLDPADSVMVRSSTNVQDACRTKRDCAN